jgi:hypothetical protein
MAQEILPQLLGFRFQLSSTGFGQTIVFRAAIVFGVSPKRGGPAFLFHAMQGGKQGAGLDDKSATRHLLDSAGDAQAMQFAGPVISR